MARLNHCTVEPWAGKMNSEGKQKQFELLGIQVIEVNFSES